ncbi:MAG: sensor histidine kinase [Thermomicrobium sp.]
MCIENSSYANHFHHISSFTHDLVERIVLDIHDGPVQNLFAALGRLTSLRSQLERKERVDRETLLRELTTIARGIEWALGDLRLLLNATRTWLLEGDFAAALEDLIAQYEELTSLTIHLSLPPELPTLPLSHRMALYRIVQEALANVYRHAGTDVATVTLTVDGDTLVLIVQDHGRGFSTEQQRHSPVGAGQHGLTSIAQRARLIGGQASIESTPGQGTRIRIEVPLHG